MKPHIHAQSSAKKWGGKAEDYLDIHQWFDATKEQFPTNAHRALRHHTFGIFEAERVFGITRVNSDGKLFSIRDIGEQHCMEDMGFIPTVSDYFQFLEYQDWFHGNGLPPSQQKKKEPKTDLSKITFDGTQPINIPQTEPPIFDDITKPSIIDRNRLID